ncbi:trypsin-like serine peptidase [Streptomyces sp. NPDC059785]|uniref:trypsin-like serine peptidase n=1 Tax=Streptomyces sp. NPDC059785 TaxID=3346945 RepID=UPI00364915B9
MSEGKGAGRRVRTGAVAAVLVLLALASSGCGADGGKDALFSNPVVAGLWSSERMGEAAAEDMLVSDGMAVDAGKTDPEPEAVEASGQPSPYLRTAPVVGKLFFDSDDGPGVCSATVVDDPAQPGASDLVWTAGHCVHGGAGGDWFSNIVFVPAYNSDGLTGEERQAATTEEVAPLGVWWADAARTSPEWMRQGRDARGGGASFDYAVLHVRPPSGSGSLEQVVGQAVPLWFDAPSATYIPAVKAWGYPAEAPFDGETLWTCQDRPGRLSLGPDSPTMYRIGCTMNAGASGGGWFAQRPDGELALISNTSIGPADPVWLAGPRLNSSARALYTAISESTASASPEASAASPQ